MTGALIHGTAALVEAFVVGCLLAVIVFAGRGRRSP